MLDLCNFYKNRLPEAGTLVSKVLGIDAYHEFYFIICII